MSLTWTDNATGETHELSDVHATSTVEERRAAVTRKRRIRELHALLVAHAKGQGSAPTPRQISAAIALALAPDENAE